MTFEELVRTYPLLFHMAERDSWASIEAHGLLSTSALLDMFGFDAERKGQIESSQRPESVEIEHENYGNAVIRDQKPMSDASLSACLKDGLTPEEWYRILNSKVFFWTSVRRLHKLLKAGSYKDEEHDVLTIKTAELVDRYPERLLLSPMNSGCSIPFKHPRGRDTFLPVDEYDFESWRGKRPKWDAVVEVVIEGGVPDVSEMVLRVDRMKRERVIYNIWTKPDAKTLPPGVIM